MYVAELDFRNRPEIGHFSRRTRTSKAPPNAYQVLKPIPGALGNGNYAMHRIKAKEVEEFYEEILPPPKASKHIMQDSVAASASVLTFQMPVSAKKLRKKYFAGIFDERKEDKTEVISSHIPKETRAILNEPEKQLLRRPKLPNKLYNLPLIYPEDVQDELRGYHMMQNEERPCADDLVIDYLATYWSDDPDEHNNFYKKHFPLLLRAVPRGIYLKPGAHTIHTVECILSVDIRTSVHASAPTCTASNY